MQTNRDFDFSHLTAAQRIQLAHDLWDSLEAAEIDAECPLTEEQRAELGRRLEDLERNPDAGIPWEKVRSERQHRDSAQGGAYFPTSRPLTYLFARTRAGSPASIWRSPMSYMRGAHYLWTDGEQIHLWAAAGYDGWDQSGWAHARGLGTDAVAVRPHPAPSGVALPQTVADEYVLMRLAELIEDRTAVAVLDRTVVRQSGNGGASALAEVAPALRQALAALTSAPSSRRIGAHTAGRENTPGGGIE